MTNAILIFSTVFNIIAFGIVIFALKYIRNMNNFIIEQLCLLRREYAELKAEKQKTQSNRNFIGMGMQ